MCKADDCKLMVTLWDISLHSCHRHLQHRREDGRSVGTSPFADTTCGVGSPIRLHVFQVSMSLITVIYWRSSGDKCRHQECLTSSPSQQNVQGSSRGGDSCAKVSYGAAFGAIARRWRIPGTTAAVKEGLNKDNPSEWGEETLISKKRGPARSVVLRPPWFGPLLTSVLPVMRCPSSKACISTSPMSGGPALAGAVLHPPHFCICLS